MFRQGQWVLFDNTVRGAHRTKAGRTVGIHTGGRVYPCTPHGENISTGEGYNLSFPVEQLINPSPLLDVNDIPEPRRAAMKKDWLPLEARPK